MTVRMNAVLRRRAAPGVSFDEGWYADRIGSSPRPANAARQRPESAIFARRYASGHPRWLSSAAISSAAVSAPFSCAI